MILELIAIASSAVSFGFWLDLRKQVKALKASVPETHQQGHERREAAIRSRIL
jgi:hypothetical protein